MGALLIRGLCQDRIQNPNLGILCGSTTVKKKFKRRGKVYNFVGQDDDDVKTQTWTDKSISSVLTCRLRKTSQEKGKGLRGGRGGLQRGVEQHCSTWTKVTEGQVRYKAVKKGHKAEGQQ